MPSASGIQSTNGETLPVLLKVGMNFSYLDKNKSNKLSKSSLRAPASTFGDVNNVRVKFCLEMEEIFKLAP